MKIVKYLLILFFVSSIIMSCDDDICTSKTESLLNTEINVVDEDLINGLYLDSLSIYSPEWSDSIHYWKDGSSNILSFMLSPNDLNTTIILTSKQEVLKDTVKIFHQSEMFFLSPECGFILIYKIDSFTNSTNLIDSAFLETSNITNDDNGLIKIYL